MFFCRRAGKKQTIRPVFAAVGEQGGLPEPEQASRLGGGRENDTNFSKNFLERDCTEKKYVVK